MVQEPTADHADIDFDDHTHNLVQRQLNWPHHAFTSSAQLSSAGKLAHIWPISPAHQGMSLACVTRHKPNQRALQLGNESL